MYYRINVFRISPPAHVFTTDKVGMSEPEAALKLFALFKVKFPVSEGYGLELTEWHEQGKFLEVIGR